MAVENLPRYCRRSCHVCPRYHLVIIYAFYTMGKVSAVLLTVWLVLVAASDGPMKAVIFGRGAAVPMLVIFLGAIGGFIAIGFLGLFIGAVVLSVGYKLFEAWMGGELLSDG